jgi:hypothetical protein
MTIASSVETEEELALDERMHICPEKALANLLAQELAHEARSPQH